MSLWLIVRVQERIGGDEPPLATLSVRARAEGVSVAKVEKLLASAGFELGPVVGMARAEAWPETAVCYTSPNPQGEGRSGSSLVPAQGR